ncbi:phosphate signaling complex protein PhoU [Caldicellulosiruptoraceae bacterium PP1]
MVRPTFEHELKEIHLDLLKMGTMTEQAIDKAILALKKKDIELAQKIIENDTEIDNLTEEIEKKCAIVIATQQPLAKDLRLIIAAMRIATDIERIADHASDISEITIKLSKFEYIKPLVDIPKMADITKEMLKMALDSYVRSDLELSNKVINMDDLVDDMYDKLLIELQEIMSKDTSSIPQCINFLLVIKYLERIADHSTNIAEWVLYKITGKLKHEL